MIPFVLIAVLLGHPGDHPYSKNGMQINGSQRGISGKMLDCPHYVPTPEQLADARLYPANLFPATSQRAGAPHGPGANGHHG